MNGYEKDFEAKREKKTFETPLMVLLLLLRALCLVGLFPILFYYRTAETQIKNPMAGFSVL